nr:uncharacterized protein LOC108133899 [Drosophila bipectinata]
MNRDIETRSMILGCNIENARNARIEQEELARRIAISLIKSREYIEEVRKLQIELAKLKIAVNNSLTNSESELHARRLLNKLTAIVANLSLLAELTPELIRELLARPDEEDLDEQDSIEEPTGEENVSEEPATEQE